MNEFSGRVAVITGAASGIGRAIAQHCVREKMNVVLADVEEDALNQTEEELMQEGTDVLAVLTDVSNFDDVKALAQKTRDTFGAVHLLCSNAGVVLPSGSIWESSLNDWKWIMGVNLWGAIHSTLAFVPMMLEQDTECNIVYSASSAGLVSASIIGPYGVTKHGIVSLAETLAHQLADRGAKIHVSVLCPGYVNTRLWDSQRNRPTEFQDTNGLLQLDADDELVSSRSRSAFDRGMPPDQVANYVFDAIKRDEFYIFTDPNEKLNVQNRFEKILQESNLAAL